MTPEEVLVQLRDLANLAAQLILKLETDRTVSVTDSRETDPIEVERLRTAIEGFMAIDVPAVRVR